jgi:hypothetical protein
MREPRLELSRDVPDRDIHEVAGVYAISTYYFEFA